MKTIDLNQSADAGASGLQTGQSSRPKPVKLERPLLEHGASEADWAMFINRWERYKINSKFSDQQDIIDQFWGCLACSSDGWSRRPEE